LRVGSAVDFLHLLLSEPRWATSVSRDQNSASLQLQTVRPETASTEASVRCRGRHRGCSRSGLPFGLELWRLPCTYLTSAGADGSSGVVWL